MCPTLTHFYDLLGPHGYLLHTVAPLAVATHLRSNLPTRASAPAASRTPPTESIPRELLDLSFHRHKPLRARTSPQLQANVLLHIVEPARDLYAATVHTAVIFVGVGDGQGDIASPDTALKFVFW